MIVWIRAMGRVLRRRETRPMLTEPHTQRPVGQVRHNHSVELDSCYSEPLSCSLVSLCNLGKEYGELEPGLLHMHFDIRDVLFAGAVEEKSQVQRDRKADERGNFVEADSGRNPPDYHRQAVDRMGGFQAGKLARIGAQRPVFGMYNCDSYARQLEEAESGDLSASRRLLVPHGTSSFRERHPPYPASGQPDTRHVRLSARPSAASLPPSPSLPLSLSFFLSPSSFFLRSSSSR